MSLVTHPMFGIVVGALVTFVVARHYYISASKELLAEAQKLQNLTAVALRALEAGGIYKMARDASGNIVGLAHGGSGNLVTPSATLSGDGNSGTSSDQ